MSGLYNFTQNLDPNFNIMASGFKGPTANVGGGYPGGTPNISPNPMNPSGANKAMMQGTNGQVKITVTTRTTDPKKINSAMLAFIDNKDFDRPTLHGLQEVNRLIVAGSTKKFEQNKFVGNPGSLDNKKEIIDRFKLLGVVSNNDVDTDVMTYKNTMSYDRGPRTFTIVTWGDTFLLNYWSTSSNTLRRYDECYLVLKRVKLEPGNSYQANITESRHGIPTPFDTPINYNQHYWQWVPVSCRGGAIPSKELINKYSDENKKSRYEVGSYLRVGKVHEYGDVGHHKLYSGRGEMSVARDVSYLHQGGRVRPFQFYLHLDDETKLV